jgi:hypothetical protein
VVALLLAHGADCNATAAGGETPLLVAARAQSYRVTAALLSEPGVDADAADKHGLTPLMAAAAMGNELLVAALLAVGADPTVACSPGASNSQLFEAFRVRIKHRETTVEEGQRKGVKGTRPALLHICIGASPGGAQGTRLATSTTPAHQPAHAVWQVEELLAERRSYERDASGRMERAQATSSARDAAHAAAETADLRVRLADAEAAVKTARQEAAAAAEEAAEGTPPRMRVSAPPTRERGLSCRHRGAICTWRRRS